MTTSKRASDPVDVNNRDSAGSFAALSLAAKGIGLASPNPLVGCIIEDANGLVIGSGTYTYEGVTHAEVIALNEAGERARGGTAYVSLEPHDHQGRTSPCTKALIEAGIRRVVCPIEDPNPLVSGSGFARLKEAGIEVKVGLLAKEAARLNEHFICWHKKQRPFVHLKLAMSLDGRISLSHSVSTALSCEEARTRVQSIRHNSDAILVGGTTSSVDDPSLTDRSGNPRRRPLVRVVLDNRLRTPIDAKLVTTANAVPTIIYTNSSNSEKINDLQNAGVEIVRTSDGGRDLKAVLDDLGRREIRSILVEGGSEVAGAFIDAGLVDRLTLIIAPIIIGGKTAPVAIGGRGAMSLAEAMRITDIEIHRSGEDIEITGVPEL